MPTRTPVPTATRAPSATPVPTIEATPTQRVDPRATATAIQQAIAEATPSYSLPVHVLSYAKGDDLKVYPDPGESNSGFSVTDFVVEVTFVNPDPGDDGVWAYGILFGGADGGSEYRVFVRSDATWVVQRGAETLRESESNALNVAEGERNLVRLLVIEGRGILFVNDRYAGSFALPGLVTPDTLWLATTNLDGRDIGFLDLSIWNLP